MTNCDRTLITIYALLDMFVGQLATLDKSLGRYVAIAFQGQFLHREIED